MLRSEIIVKELVVKDIVELELPETCQCGFHNLNIHGTRTNGILRVEVRCMRCGKPLSKLDSYE